MSEEASQAHASEEDDQKVAPSGKAQARADELVRKYRGKLWRIAEGYAIEDNEERVVLLKHVELADRAITEPPVSRWKDVLSVTGSLILGLAIDKLFDQLLVSEAGHRTTTNLVVAILLCFIGLVTIALGLLRDWRVEVA